MNEVLYKGNEVNFMEKSVRASEMFERKKVVSIKLQ